MRKLLKTFKSSPKYSIKWNNYFEIYENILHRFVNKKITLVEIGIGDGGSLFMWKKFFGKKARIIGVELNPVAKKFEKYGFEIFIGDQSNSEFWKKFFKKVGKVDIVLDDGGHTNYQQIVTTNSCIPYINDDGLMVVEDVHTSYIKKKFYNPSKYSFINFNKKLIDDINYRFPGLNSFNYSLNNYIYSIQNFESIVAFKINRKICKKNQPIVNKKQNIMPTEFRAVLDKNSILYKIKKILNAKSNFTYFSFIINSLKSLKFFN